MGRKGDGDRLRAIQFSVGPPSIFPSMTDHRHLLTGLLVGALIPSITLSLGSPGLGANLANPSSFVTVAALPYLPSLAAIAILGLPPFLLMQKLGVVHWWSVATAGVVGGGFACAFFTGFRSMSSDVHAFALWGCIGASTALTSWLIWRFGTKPQRRRANPGPAES